MPVHVLLRIEQGLRSGQPERAVLALIDRVLTASMRAACARSSIDDT